MHLPETPTPAMDALAPKFEESYNMKKDGHKVGGTTCRACLTLVIFIFSNYCMNTFVDVQVVIRRSRFVLALPLRRGGFREMSL